jgi:hypothetical protein
MNILDVDRMNNVSAGKYFKGYTPTAKGCKSLIKPFFTLAHLSCAYHGEFFRGLFNTEARTKATGWAIGGSLMGFFGLTVANQIVDDSIDAWYDKDDKEEKV